jgi:calcineurin-like phosphoesterase family protein
VSKTWFIADTHFGHASILRFCSRPWQSIEDHDQALIELWNSVVAPGDTIFHLGDFAYKCTRARCREFSARCTETST